MARSTPSAIPSATPATTSPAPAFSATMSRLGPRSRPANKSWAISALTSGLPPARSDASANVIPRSVGSRVHSDASPSRSSRIRVGPVRATSSRPSSPVTNQVCVEPPVRKTSSIRSASAGSAAPMTCRFG